MRLSLSHLMASGKRSTWEIYTNFKHLYRASYQRGNCEMLPEKQKSKYREFYDSARYNEILEPKTTLMLHLASAMAIGCYP
jgi:hypothetical protein